MGNTKQGKLWHVWLSEGHVSQHLCGSAQEAATLRVGAAAVASEMARCCGLYILAHVGDDVGEATVRGALEAGGLVGQGPGQVPDHRLLFCSTLEGKVSLVRQLEPGLHIDGHARTACPTLPPKQMLEMRLSAAEALQISARGASSRSSGSKGTALSYLPFLYAFKLLLFWKRSQGVATAAATWQRHLSAQGRLQVSGKCSS